MIGGKVLDSSALAAYVRGSLAMATWVHLAPELGLTLILPGLAIHEVRTVLPDGGEQIATLLDNPNVVRSELTAATAEQVARQLASTGLFDGMAGHVVHLSTARAWPTLSSDPGRLRRLAPEIEVEEI